MIRWFEHRAFSGELKKLSKTIRTIKNDVEKVKRLIEAHFFDNKTQGSVIAPGKIHRVMEDSSVANREIWKIEVATPGVRPNLWPRLWFMIDGDVITLLAIYSHKMNYDNNEIDRVARERYEEILDS